MPGSRPSRSGKQYNTGNFFLQYLFYELFRTIFVYENNRMTGMQKKYHPAESEPENLQVIRDSEIKQYYAIAKKILPCRKRT
jgi:hypothetical protein